jgi:hypothetical protein
MSSDKIDYLTEDTEISSQKFVVLSILTPNFYKLSEDGNGTVPKDKEGIYGIKIRGSYASYEEAQKRAKFLQTVDTLHNVFIGEVGKWLPFDDNADKACETSYAEDKLNNLMKSYAENQEQAKQLYEKRKNDMIMETLKTNKDNKKAEKENKKEKEKEKKNKEDSSLESKTDSVDLSTLVNKVETEDQATSDKVQSLEEELLRARQMLEEEMNPVRSKFEKVQDIIQTEYDKNKRIE